MIVPGRKQGSALVFDHGWSVGCVCVLDSTSCDDGESGQGGTKKKPRRIDVEAALCPVACLLYSSKRGLGVEQGQAVVEKSKGLKVAIGFL